MTRPPKDCPGPQAPEAPRFCPRCGHSLEARPIHGRTRPTCPSCRHIHFANPRVAVVLFVAEGRRVLLIKRGVWPEKGKWALPAGYIDQGEPPEAGAIREMREETGLEVAITRLLGVDYNPVSQAIVILYQARVLGGTLAAQDDAEEAGWFTPEELPELAFESTRASLKAWAAGELG